MSDLSILSMIFSTYGESVKLIRNRIEPLADGGQTDEVVLSDIIRRLMCIINSIIIESEYNYCEPVRDLINHIRKMALAIDDFKKLESSGLRTEIDGWNSKDYHSKDEGCESMLRAFRGLLELLVAE